MKKKKIQVNFEIFARPIFDPFLSQQYRILATEIFDSWGRPQSESEDTENLCLEVMASTITKLDKIGVKLHIIEVAESEFDVNLTCYSLKH